MAPKFYLLGVLAVGSAFAGAARAHSTGSGQAHIPATHCDAAADTNVANATLGQLSADYEMKKWPEANADIAKLTPLKGSLSDDDQVIFDVIVDSLPYAEAANPTPAPAAVPPTTAVPVAPAAVPVVPAVVVPVPVAVGAARPAMVFPALTAVTKGDKVAIILIDKTLEDLALNDRASVTADEGHLGKILKAKLSKPVMEEGEAVHKTAHAFLAEPARLFKQAEAEIAGKKIPAAEATVAEAAKLPNLTPAEQKRLAEIQAQLEKHAGKK